jgi:hypothetical protein
MLKIWLNLKFKHIILKHMGENLELNLKIKNMGKYMVKAIVKNMIKS